MEKAPAGGGRCLPRGARKIDTAPGADSNTHSLHDLAIGFARHAMDHSNSRTGRGPSD